MWYVFCTDIHSFPLTYAEEINDNLDEYNVYY